MKVPPIMFLGVAVAGLIITLFSLAYRSSTERQLVDPDFPPSETEVVPSWGWPFPYLVDNPKGPNPGQIGMGDRFFLTPFLVYWVGWSLLSLLVGGSLRVILRMRISNK